MKPKKIIAFEESSDLQSKLLLYLNNCKWNAGPFLAKLHSDNNFFVEGDRTYFLMDGDKVVSFLTLAHQDCIDDETMKPWIGFVYTDESYRGERNSEKLIKYALKKAKEKGSYKVFLTSDHFGLYEKYGFEYIGTRKDIYNEECKVYVYHLNKS